MNFSQIRKEKVKEYIIEGIVSFKSKRKIIKELIQLGLTYKEIDNYFELSSTDIKEKAKYKAQPFLVIGLLFTLIGVIATLKGEINFRYTYGFGMVGLCSLYASLKLYRL